MFEPPSAEEPEQPTASGPPPFDEAQLRFMLAGAARHAQRRERRRWLLALGTMAVLAGVFTAIVIGGRPLRRPADGPPIVATEPPSTPANGPTTVAAQPPTTPLHESDEVSAAPSGSAAGEPPSRRLPPAPEVRFRLQPYDRLAVLSPGDLKERVFDLFGTTVEQQRGSAIRTDGMRLRASGRSARHSTVEVAEVTLAEGAQAVRYWFLFGDGQLLAWGRPEEWLAAVASHELVIEYRPGAVENRR